MSKPSAWKLLAMSVGVLAGWAVVPAAGQQVDRDQGLVIRIDVTRWVLSHGRVDSIRSVGIQTPENPRGRPVDGITPRTPPPPAPPPPAPPPSILDVIAAQPDPLRIDMDLNADGAAARDPQRPSALVTAGATIPSGFTLVVAQLALRGDNSIDTHWKALVPRFGSGNYYATVSIPGTAIVRGQELFTREHFEQYTANSVIYEAPDIGNVIVDATIHGGTSALRASGYRVRPAQPGGVANERPSRQQTKPPSRVVGWADPLELELTEIRQTRVDLNGDGQPDATRIWINTALPNSFEPVPTRWLRVAAEANSGRLIFDVPAATVFTVDLPLPEPPGRSPEMRGWTPPDEMVNLSVVATSLGFGVPAGPVSPFLLPLAELRNRGFVVGLETFHSAGITLGDTLTVQVKEKNNVNRSLVILLDASGSMRTNNRMVRAKASAERVLRRLPADTEVALIVFYDCNRIRVEQPFTLDPADVIRILPRIQPSGGTPLAAATKFAKDYMRANASGKELDLIILSDGEETCGGDPVGAARD